PHAIAPENVLTSGRAEGPLIGGCLSVLASLCGTPEGIRGEGAILFWEDTGEDTYRLDRMLMQLERSGAFDGLRGMVVGSVVPRRDGESAETAGPISASVSPALRSRWRWVSPAGTSRARRPFRSEPPRRPPA